MRELVRQGLASVKRKRVATALRPEGTRERLSVFNMDTSQLRHPLRQNGTNGATSTHGLKLTEKKTSQGQNHNIGTAEVGFEVVAEPRSARAEFLRRAGGRELSSKEMLIAYGKSERKINELQNNIGKRTNTGDMGHSAHGENV